MVLTQRKAVELVERGKIQRLSREAIREYSEVLALEESDLIPIKLNESNSISTGRLECKQEGAVINFNPDPVSSHDVSAEYLLAEAIYEEVFHALTMYSTLQESKGKIRNKDIFWDYAANEIFGGFHRIVDDKWDLEKSFNRAEEDLWQGDPTKKDFYLIRNAIFHFAGYKLAAEIGRDFGKIRKLSRMTNAEIAEKLGIENEEKEPNKSLIDSTKRYNYYVAWERQDTADNLIQIFDRETREVYYNKYKDGEMKWVEG